MGYEISIKCQNTKQRDELKKFMENNYIESNILIKQVKGISIEDNLQGSLFRDEEYFSEELMLGFSYSSWLSEPERYYIHRVLQWMSNLCGQSNEYFYDGIEEEFDNPSPNFIPFMGGDQAYIDNVNNLVKDTIKKYNQTINKEKFINLLK